MRNIAEKLGFQMGTLVGVRQRNDNQWPNSCFCHYCGWNIFKMKLETLNFWDQFDILLEKRLSGVAELRYKMVYGKSQIKYFDMRHGDLHLYNPTCPFTTTHSTSHQLNQGTIQYFPIITTVTTPNNHPHKLSHLIFILYKYQYLFIWIFPVQACLYQGRRPTAQT